MALPPTVRVKLSSEAAGSISLTPVVVQEFAIRELVENILAVTGKDEARVRAGTRLVPRAGVPGFEVRTRDCYAPSRCSGQD